MESTSLPLSFDLSFPSELGYEKVAREAVASIARRLGFQEDQIDDLKTVLAEACVNAIEHGNRRTPGMRVQVRCAWDELRLTVEICDQGVARFQGCAAPVTIETKLGGCAPRRGMGLLIIAQLVDESGFTDNPDGGNRFWFAMKRPGHSMAPHAP